MTTLQKHKEHKETYSYWLPTIPEHWQWTRVKFFFDERKDKGFENEPLLACTQTKGVILKKDFKTRTVLALKDLHTLKLVKIGDFVISLRSFQGGIEYAYAQGIISPAYTILQLKEGAEDFYKHLFKSRDFIKLLQTLVTGIRDGQNIDNTLFKNSFLPVPPLSEQTKIAQFLNYKCQQIDSFIQKKKRLLTVLEEKKQAIINQAVTKGINPNIKMKDSGIEWLGGIPEHWKVRRLRYIGQCQNGINIGAEYFGSGHPFFSYGDIYKNYQLPFNGSGLVQSSDSDRKTHSVQEGDVFFTRTSETIEEIGFTSTCFQTAKDATFAGFLIRFRPSDNKLHKGFSKYFFRSQLHRAFFVKEMNLVTRASLSQELLKKLPVLLPPLSEQKEIAIFLEKELKEITQAQSLIQKEIKLIQEYKNALISEAVTGKIDVREWEQPN